MQETGIATSGIAHTRWATCGEKVDRNSHPHFDQGKQIYLVHNGILTNHASLKNDLLHDLKFTSSTDTEVIVQFLALRRREGKTMLEALEEFKARAGKDSQWGLVIIDRATPDTIYTATNGSPLLIGFSA
jgi:glucosamine--fructose-6-phosphate aminotransferase (isomerizing)